MPNSNFAKMKETDKLIIQSIGSFFHLTHKIVENVNLLWWPVAPAPKNQERT